MDSWRWGNKDKLTPVEKIVVDAVLHNFGELSGKTLGDFTHRPGTAWTAIREENGVPEGDPSQLVIPKDYISERAPKVPAAS